MAKSSDRKSVSNRQPSQPTRQPTSADTEMLTPFEMDLLKREAREAAAYGKKVFAKIRPKG